MWHNFLGMVTVIALLITGSRAWAVSATGGNVTNAGAFTFHTFTNSGTFTVASGGTLDVLIVAGGGGGGANGGGGGGAGGLIYTNSMVVTNGQIIAVTVGASGTPHPNTAVAVTTGGSSSFGSLIAIGGGGGASRDNGPQGAAGGSGGGGSGSNGGSRDLAGAGTVGQGNNGGNGTLNLGDGYDAAGGGGGGAGGAGTPGAYRLGGNGGPGLQFTNFAVVGGSPAGWFAGGGAGAKVSNGSHGVGGTNGGGGNASVAGVQNTGGGGGASASGGSGIVIISYDAGSPFISNQTATNLTTSSATLVGYLLTTGASPTAVSVYWGTNDGGTIAGNWQYIHTFEGAQDVGLISTNVSFAVSNVTYYYRFYATNDAGECWASSSEWFQSSPVWVEATTATAAVDSPGAFTLYRPVTDTNAGLTVSYSLSGGAVNGQDYASLSGSASFPAGGTAVVVAVTAAQDMDYTNETVTLNLQEGRFVLGDPASASVTITPWSVLGSKTGNWYVAVSGSDAGDGTNWATAFATISNAVAHATSGQSVLVGMGTFSVTAQINVVSNILLQSVLGAASTTVNRASGDTRIFYMNHASAVVDGFSIVGGSLSASSGAGVYLSNGLLKNCDIRGHYAQNGGSGIYMNGGVVSNCVLRQNSGNCNLGTALYMQGGTCRDSQIVSNTVNFGLHVSGGSVAMTAGTLFNCIIANNWQYGGQSSRGILNISGGTISNCVFRNNTLTGNADYGEVGGGGVYMTGGLVTHSRIYSNILTNATGTNPRGGAGVYLASAGTVRNCLIFGNSSTYQGAGIRMVSSGTIQNCTVANNSAPTVQGGGIYMTAGMVENTIAYLNTGLDTASANIYQGGGTVRYSCSTPLISGGSNTNNTDTDPSFINAAATNYHLLPLSSCVDAGATIAAVTSDLDETPRPLDGNGDSVAAYDMGAYELDPAAGELTCDFSADTNAGLDSVTVVFTALIAGANTNGLQYWWDFGNGLESGSDKRVVTNTYSTYGLYSVVLVVSNEVPVGAMRVKSNLVAVVKDGDTYVLPGAAHQYPYDSWANASTGIQEAVEVSQVAVGLGAASHTVWIGEGTYVLPSVITINRALLIQCTNGPTGAIVDGRGVVRGFDVSSTGAVLSGLTISNCSAVTASGIVMTGGTITNCIVTRCQSGWAVYATGGTIVDSRILANVAGAGGIYLQNATLRDSTVNGNYCTGDGGGVYLQSGLISGCMIQTNRTGLSGGGLRLVSGTVTNCLITHNYANIQNHGGGGVYQTGGALTHSVIASNYINTGGHSSGGGINLAGGLAKNCRIIGNYTAGGQSMYGGGVYLAGGTLRNALVAGNETKAQGTMTGYGGGVHLAGGVMENCTITRNTTHLTYSSVGGGVYRTGGVATNCIVYFNNAALSSNVNTAVGFAYSCAPELTPDTNGNIIAEPYFEAAGSGYGMSHTPGDYRLNFHSPCANGGTNLLAWMTNAVDLAGELRIQNKVVDMGTYEVVIPAAGTLLMIW